MNPDAILDLAAQELDDIPHLPVEPVPVVFDKIGQQIKLGSIVVYGHALGRCAALQLGKILSIKVTYKTAHRCIGQDMEKGWQYEEYEQPEYRFSVQGVNMHDNWSPDETPSLLRKGTLQFPSRIIVLDPAVIPEKIRTLLDSVA